MTSIETIASRRTSNVDLRVPASNVEQPAPAVAPPVSSLTRDFLEWLASKPRTYSETMEAWRTSCPRFTIWEDAVEAGLVRLERAGGSSLSAARVALTSRGQTVVDQAG